MPSSTPSCTEAVHRVVMIEDQTVVRELVLEMLAADPKYNVIGATAEGSVGIKLTEEHQPDLLILDITLPDISGVEVLHRLRYSAPDLKILIFTGKEEKHIARGLMRDGVRGFIRKNSRLSELRQAVETVATGGTWFNAEFNHALIGALKNREAKIDQMAITLTDRERSIAILLAQSYSSKEVGTALNISTKTAENHRTNLMRKLGVHDVAGVIRFVIRQGLYDPNNDA
jgi:DNA-binding NarL/FixJ family response regulator